MSYRIEEVDGEQYADEINQFNALDPETFPPLSARHLSDGFWWLVYHKEPISGDTVPSRAIVAFAGLTPMTPFDGYGYLKRAYVLPDHRGHGLQLRLMVTRETKARQIGWTHLVSECGAMNGPSARNFARAGFERCDPEQRWGAEGSIYFVKRLS